MGYCTDFTLFYLVFEGNSKYKPPGAYIWRGNEMEGFFALRVWGAGGGDLYYGGAYT